MSKKPIKTTKPLDLSRADCALRHALSVHVHNARDEYIGGTAMYPQPVRSTPKIDPAKVVETAKVFLAFMDGR